MSKKVLGIYEKDSTIHETRFGIWYEVHKNNLVSVRLASESVDLKWLKDWCKKNQAKTKMSPKEWVCVKYLLVWAKKEAKKK